MYKEKYVVQIIHCFYAIITVSLAFVAMCSIGMAIDFKNTFYGTAKFSDKEEKRIDTEKQEKISFKVDLIRHVTLTHILLPPKEYNLNNEFYDTKGNLNPKYLNVLDDKKLFLEYFDFFFLRGESIDFETAFLSLLTTAQDSAAVDRIKNNFVTVFRNETKTYKECCDNTTKDQPVSGEFQSKINPSLMLLGFVTFALKTRRNFFLHFVLNSKANDRRFKNRIRSIEILWPIDENVDDTIYKKKENLVDCMENKIKQYLFY